MNSETQLTPANDDLKPVSYGTMAIERRQNMAVGQALGVDEILAQVNLIQNVMHRVMKEGEHYGKIPGCGDKATLLQPGAQKLTMTFRLAPEYEIQEANLDRGHKEYRVICTLKSVQSGTFVGQGVGCCSTMESKYRYRGGQRKCPHCGKETIIKGKAEYGGGWLCFAKKGGCGAKWPDGAQEIEGQSVERVEHDNPADFYNTVLKMSKKRAFVDATITATAASDIFTQDVGDDESEEPTQPELPKAKPTPTPAPPKPITVPPATVEQKQKLIEMLGADPMVLEFYQKLCSPAVLMDNEILEDLPLWAIPTTQKQFRELGLAIAEFRDGLPARHPFPYNRDSAAVSSVAAASPAAAPVTPLAGAPPTGDEEPWRTFPLPYGKDAGVLLGKLSKNKLFGWWANFKVETQYNGKPRAAADIELGNMFREMLDCAGKVYQFTKKE